MSPDGRLLLPRGLLPPYKAGELCERSERFDRLYLLTGNRILDEVPTRRGGGKSLL